MLQLVLGRAGSGKTRYSRELFKAPDPDCAGRQMLIVPEQYSFESEKAILEMLGPQRAKDVVVTSFSRLTEMFFRIYGGLVGERLSDGGRVILMELAASQMIDQLEVYAGPAKRGELGQFLISALSELKSSALSADDLLAYSRKLTQGELSKKLSEVSLIFSAYESLIEHGYADPLDDLTKMAKMLPQTDFFLGASVVIDSFSGFTAQEMLIIREILRKADSLTVALCTDSLEDRENGFGRFSSIKKTAEKLIRAAREENIPVAAPVYLTGAPRFGSEELRLFEAGLFDDLPELYDGEPESVSVFGASDLYEEAEFVASEIRRLVMEEGYRYREIAVFSRSPEKYLGILDAALEKREIPFFMDRPQEVSRKPLCRLIESALKIAESGFDSNVVFTYLKTGLAGLTDDEIFRLENYTFVWNISGRKWLDPFTENPEGFSSAQSAETEEELAALNQMRVKVIRPLEKLRAALQGADGRTAAEAIYRFLEELSVQKSIDDLAKEFDQLGEREESELLYRLWDLVMNDLDQIAAAAGDTILDLPMLRRVFEALFSSNRLAEIPQRLDQVSVSAAQRSRPEGIRAAFLIGTVRGEFPLTPSLEGLFTDRERKELIGLGMPIGRTFEESASEELLLAYEAACSASERLYLSFPKSSSAFESELVLGAEAVLPKLRVKSREDYPDEFFASSLPAAFSSAAQRWRENSSHARTLREIFENEAQFTGRTAAIERALDEKPVSITDHRIAASLFGRGHRLSATQIETYHLCRFRYFCQYGLRAKKLETAKIDALQYGSLMHYLLEKLFLHHNSAEIAAMDEKNLRAKIAALCDEYAEQNFGGQREKGKRFQAVIARLGDSAYYLIVHIAQELSQSLFEPESFELEVGGDELPLVIPTGDGGAIRLVGKIDRVDSYRNGSETYLRVIDYKTGMKEFRYSDLLCGLNLQMLIYLGALIENRRGKAAGVLYMPSRRPLVSVERDADEEETGKQIAKQFQMKGVVLDNREVLSAMEENLEAKYIPVGISKGKVTGQEFLLSEGDFEKIHRLIEKKIVTMQRTLEAGDIDAKPLMENRFGCEYCPYFAICGKHYDSDEVQNTRKSKKEFFDFMKEE
ncbi:MAG: PD-(D/E)XK nuclease family protein [Clostridia bacterium]|nr:PD-(D/E)XK nuclease family protein [Clostridia bacterium]